MTGLLYVAVIIAGVMAGQSAFLALQLLLAVLAVNEFSRLSTLGPRGWAINLLDTIGAILLVMGANLIGGYNAAWSFPGAAFALAFYMVYIVSRLVAELFLDNDRPISSLGHSMLGQVCVALPIAAMTSIYSGACGHAMVMTMFVMIWLNDTGAYCVGSLAGRHKLFERISPKKTWEGFFGGLAFDIIAGILAATLLADHYPASMGIGGMIGLGVIVSVIGTLGDLVESMMKRAVNVKDSGHLLPGHGGILDRIDSLLLVVPATIVYLTIYFYF